MMTEIEEQVNDLDINDTHSMIMVAPDTDKDNITDFTEQALANKQKEKKLRRISLPPDTYRKSKFASWIQHYNLPSTPCRNNSRASRTSIGSSSSDPSNDPSLLTPSTSPTSIDTSPLPTPTSLTDQLPPRTSSLQPASHEEQRATPHRSVSTPDHHEKRKKRFLPLVSRIRDRSAKKTLNINPPEPPPQLLLSALHCSDDNSPAPFDVDHQTGTTTPMSSIAESPTSFYWTETHHSDLTFPDNNDDNRLSSSTDPSLRVRRRSSCPLMTTTQQECVMMRSFCSTMDSSIPGSIHMTPVTPLAVAQDIYDEDQQCVLSFSTMKPRSRPLRRKTSGKREKRALRAWHDTLVALLKAEQDDDGTSSHKSPSTLSMDQLPNEKRERYALTRKFILREFYLTEVTFWNQLYYSKVMFFDPLQLSLDRHSTFTRPSDLDLFSNLPDLMQCSSQLIRSMAPFLDKSPLTATSPSTPTTPSYQDLTSIITPIASSSSSTTSTTTQSTLFDHSPQRRPLSHHDSFSTTSSSIPSSPTSSTTSSNSSTVNVPMLPIHLNTDTRTLASPNDQLLLGKEICAMANQFVVFLRWALDYKLNRKKLDHRSQHNKGFATYQEKLSMRKETNQFHVHDYLIIPIQRITRYGLLLADLQKHTEKDHPDYPHICRARMILTSLAVAMNKAQQK